MKRNKMHTSTINMFQERIDTIEKDIPKMKAEQEWLLSEIKKLEAEREKDEE